jgi:tetratricopeptide (TPR) repeat protein
MDRKAVRSLADQDKERMAKRLSARGAHLLRSGQAEQALPLLLRAYALWPADPATAANLGGALVMAHEYERAIPILERACDQAPDNVAIWINLGAAYLGERESAGDVQQLKAIEAFEQALLLDPIAPNVHYSLGLIHRDRGEIERAIHRFHQAVQANPLDQHARRAWQRLQDEEKNQAKADQRS